MKNLNLGVISFAHFHGYNYARCIQELPGASLTAVSDDDENRGMKASEQYGVEYIKNYHDLLRREDIDAVVITAENIKHAPIAVDAFEAGKHVICEKPLATTLKDADLILKAAEKAGVTFQTAFVMRYHSTTCHIKNILTRGDIGKIVAITGTNRLKWLAYGWFLDPKLSGGGAVMDHTVHLADLMRWYTGSEVKKVYTEIGKNIHPEIKVEDNFLTMVHFENDVFGTIDGSWSRPASYYTWGDVTLEIIGTEGMILLDAFRQAVYLVEKEAPKDRLEWIYWGCDADREMVKSFIECIRNDGEPVASGFDGRQATEITLASYESAKQNSTVKLPLS